MLVGGLVEVVGTGGGVGRSRGSGIAGGSGARGRTCDCIDALLAALASSMNLLAEAGSITPNVSLPAHCTEGVSLKAVSEGW